MTCLRREPQLADIAASPTMGLAIAAVEITAKAAAEAAILRNETMRFSC
jgi:hypothetical protein